MAQFLLQNGTVLIHDQNEDVKAVRTDILIKSNKIAKIGTGISTPDATVIDCTDKVISPGFIDTHHHVWQTQLKGRHANHTLMQYMPSGNFTAFLYKAEDVFWGQLGGLLEMLDGGTTAVVDYAHISMSPEHSTGAPVEDDPLRLMEYLQTTTPSPRPSPLVFAQATASPQILASNPQTHLRSTPTAWAATRSIPSTNSPNRVPGAMAA